MRIAERGHDLESDSEREYGFSAGSRRGQEVGNSGLSRSVGAAEGESSKRQRSITMRPDSRSSLDMDTPTKRIQGRKAGIGLGQPPNSSGLRKTATSNRSASSRTPQNQTTAQGSGFAPRSASLNLLSSTSMGVPSSASSSRLGVAAHLVPPENTYTPPKGANWDEVVLPTVAKKLGMSEAEREEGEEGDLAVEWDKDGVPIKWVKKGILSTSQSSNVSTERDCHSAGRLINRQDYRLTAQISRLHIPSHQHSSRLPIIHSDPLKTSLHHLGRTSKRILSAINHQINPSIPPLYLYVRLEVTLQTSSWNLRFLQPHSLI